MDDIFKNLEEAPTHLLKRKLEEGYSLHEDFSHHVEQKELFIKYDMMAEYEKAEQVLAFLTQNILNLEAELKRRERTTKVH